MSFWASLFGGSNPTLTSTMKGTGQIADFSSGQGQTDTTLGTNWNKSILSGDPTKIATALAPAISAGQKGVQEQKNQIAQFGNRSGGSTAKANSLESESRGNITNMVGGLQSGAASSLLSTGKSLLSTALTGLNQTAEMSQRQMENWSNSILGKGITSAIASGEAAGLGAAGV